MMGGWKKGRKRERKGKANINKIKGSHQKKKKKKNSKIFQVIGFFKFSSVAQSCLTLCDPMDCSTPGLPVHH